MYTYFCIGLLWHWSWGQNKVLFHQPLELPLQSPRAAYHTFYLTSFLNALANCENCLSFFIFIWVAISQCSLLGALCSHTGLSLHWFIGILVWIYLHNLSPFCHCDISQSLSFKFDSNFSPVYRCHFHTRYPETLPKFPALKNIRNLCHRRHHHQGWCKSASPLISPLSPASACFPVAGIFNRLPFPNLC